MAEKSLIIEALGEGELLLPALLNAALAANDRAKFHFTLLQLAREHARRPDGAVPSLRNERIAAGVDDEGLDGFIARAQVEGDGFRAAGLAAVCTDVDVSLDVMLAPLRLADADAAAAFVARLEALRGAPWSEGDHLSDARLARLASGDRDHGDTAHLLVMDLHKALNALQAAIAEERIEGAACYGLDAADRPRVAAFMQGIARTTALKFEHPGLGTTATRSGETLLIQNDIGTTDAHVLVVRVGASAAGLTASLTYTDVHLQRLLFFQGLFEDWEVAWDDTRSRTDQRMEDGAYHMSSGRFSAEDEDELSRYLTFLGSRLVFLIDWNRARKRLRPLLPKKDVLALLKWAADRDYGHMALLRVDAVHVIFDALGFLARGDATAQTRLDELLGRNAALDYLRFVVAACATGALEGRSEGLIADEIRTGLVSYFQSAQDNLLDLASEHAALCVELAAGVRDALLHADEPTAAEQFALNARRAARWEHDADELLQGARGLARKKERGLFYRSLIEHADDIADALEEAGFHLTLLGAEARRARLFAALSALAESAASSTQEYLKAVESSRDLKRGSPRADIQDFLEAVHRVVDAEHRSDAQHRGVKCALMAEAGIDARALYAFAECARNLEEAADALTHTVLTLRDFVLEEVMEQ